MPEALAYFAITPETAGNLAQLCEVAILPLAGFYFYLAGRGLLPAPARWQNNERLLWWCRTGGLTAMAFGVLLVANETAKLFG